MVYWTFSGPLAHQHRNGEATPPEFLVALVVIQVVVLAVASGGSRAINHRSVATQGDQARYAAEAVVNMALREFAANADHDSNGVAGAIASSGSPLLINDASAWCTISTSTTGNATTGTIIASASHGPTRRRLQVVATRTTSTSGGFAGFYTQVWEPGTNLSNINSHDWTSNPDWIGIAPQMHIPSQTDRARWPGQQGTRYRMSWRGSISIPAGTHGFSVTSDDGAGLYLNGVPAVVFPTQRGCGTTTGTAVISGGTMNFEGRYFENTGGQCFTGQWRPDNTGAWINIDNSMVTATPSIAVAPVALAGAATINGDSSPGSAFIDAFDSSAGPYGGTNVQTNQAVLSTNSTTSGSITITGAGSIRGSAQTGPGAAPSAVTLSGGSTIAGGTSTLAYRIALHEYNHLGTIPSTSGSVNTSGNFSLSSSARYTSYQLNGAGSTLTINGDVTMFVDGNFSLSGGARVVVSSGSRLTLIVGGNVNVWNDSRLNMSPGLPGQCRVIINAGNTARTISITDTGQAAAEIWATWCTLNLYTNAELYGTFRGRVLNMTGQSSLHADIATISGSGSGQTTTTAVTQWSELEPQ